MTIIKSRNNKSKKDTKKIGGSIGVSSYSLDEQSKNPVFEQSAQDKQIQSIIEVSLLSKREESVNEDASASGIAGGVSSDSVDLSQKGSENTVAGVNEDMSGIDHHITSDDSDVTQDQLLQESRETITDLAGSNNNFERSEEKNLTKKTTRIIRGFRENVDFSKFSESSSDSNTGSIGVTLEVSYPRIIPLSSSLLENNASNSTESRKYAMVGTSVLTGIVFIGSGTIKNALTTQLGKAITNKNAAANIVEEFGVSFLLKNSIDLSTIHNVGEVKSRAAMDFSRKVFSKTAITIKSLDSLVDGIKLYNEPNAKHFEEVVMGCNNLYAMVSGNNVYTLGIVTVDIAYNLYQGEYTQVATQIILTSPSLLLLSMMGFAGAAQSGTYYGLAGALIMGGVFIKNMHSLYEELYVNNAYGTNSMIAYRDFFKYLSETPYLKDIYDFNSKAIKYDIEINNAMRDIAVRNLENFLAEKGSFGEKIDEKGAFSSAIKQNYVLLNKVSEGKITVEEAETLWKNYVTIELEDAFYDRCIEIDNIYNDNKVVYRCYSENSKSIDNVIIGEDNSVETYPIP
ncbi:MAG: hypothetical protein N4A31_02595 [Rickettsiales bacterium]|jgi:hypothetical protein|nr:hypothetical protein [Rickettsiales bacterium]